MSMPTQNCSECSKSDNLHWMCPPRMSDGRHFTNYKPRCSMHRDLLPNKDMSSFELRQYMINNAEKMMMTNRKEWENENACGPCKEPWNQGTMLPEHSIVKCNKQTCQTMLNDPNGLGIGRDYNIPSQDAFIAQKAQQNKSFTDCCVGYEKDSLYYPYGLVQQEEDHSRYSIPSGGKPFPSMH